MTSSIFSSENIRAYLRLDATQRRSQLLLVALLLVVLLLGHWLSASVEAALLPYGRFASLVRAQAALSETTRVIFAGSSHVRMGIRPEQFSFEGLRIAGPGWDYSTLEAAVRSNLERMPDLELAVIEFDVLPMRIDTSVVQRGRCQGLRVWGVGPEEVPCEDRKLDSGVLASSVYPLIPRRRITPHEIWLELGPRLTGPQPDTREPIDAHRRFDRHGPRRVRWLQDNFGESDLRRNRAALKRLVELLLRHGTRVILMQMPHHRSFSDSVPPQWRRESKTILHQLRMTTGQRIPLWDFERSPEFRPLHFMDSVHLNASGAARFSTRLDARIRRYLD